MPDYLTAVRDNATAFARAANHSLELAVPGCPGWRLSDLVLHLGEVYEFWRIVMMSGSTDYETAIRPAFDDFRVRAAARRSDPAFAEPGRLLSWFEARRRELVEALEAVEPSTPIWTWFPPRQNAEFIRRRMAHETAIHRWDAQSAHGHAAAIAGELARDGIDEVFDVFVPGKSAASSVKGHGETYHFHRADGDGEWSVRFDTSGVTVTRDHRKGDVAVRGSASDLLLFLWRRVPADRLEVFGDSSLLLRYFELVPPS